MQITTTTSICWSSASGRPSCATTEKGTWRLLPMVPCATRSFAPLSVASAPATSVAAADLDLDGRADLVWDGPTIAYARDGGKFEVTSLGKAGPAVACDGDGDGLPDIASIEDGSLVRWH